MAEIPSSLPGTLIIRTYPKDYAASDTQSEGEAQFEFEADTEEEEQYSISTRLEQNREYMDHQIASSSRGNFVWICETQSWQTTDGTAVVLIRQPTASNMSHRLLNAYIYRNIKKVGTLNDLAALLGTPEDWEERYNNVVADGLIVRYMEDFRNLPDDTAESDIRSDFIGLVSNIALY
ncbi:MAG: hypothetical protein ACK5PF_03270, partial [bacterium]